MTGDPFGAVAGRGGDRIDGEREHNDGEFHLVARPKARRQTELNASSLGRDGCAIVARGGERLYGLVRPGLGLRPRVASSSFAVRCHRSGAPRRARCHSRQAPRRSEGISRGDSVRIASGAGGFFWLCLASSATYLRQVADFAFDHWTDGKIER